jgi:16S rRNA (guanine527-N7)-methyltransferase
VKIRPFGLVLTEKINERIRRYCNLVVAWNRRHALLSRQDVENILQKHVGASLGALLLVESGRGERWVDIGSGAGLPGLVLKSWDPAQEIVLVERSLKKGVFLQHAVRELDLGPVTIHTEPAEALIEKGELLRAFDVLFSRAVTDLKTTLRMFGPVLRDGGKMVTFKGPAWRTDVEDARLNGLLGPDAYDLEQVLCVPWAPGHLLLLRTCR